MKTKSNKAFLEKIKTITIGGKSAGAHAAPKCPDCGVEMKLAGVIVEVRKGRRTAPRANEEQSFSA